MEYSIFIYKQNTYKIISDISDVTCESITIKICKELNITPAVSLLFSLRIQGTSTFLPPCRILSQKEKYEFRFRFMLPSLDILKVRDKAASDYLYHQIKYDLLENKIPELEYPNHKEKVLGLSVTIMYIELLEFKTTKDSLKANYTKFVPQKYLKKHPIYLQKHIRKAIDEIKNMNHDAYYVKYTFIDTINTLAPNYLGEKYFGQTSYPEADRLVEQGKCPVEVHIHPFHSDRPGFSVYYPYNKQWKHLGSITNIQTIVLDFNEVNIEIRSENPLTLINPNKLDLESFVSCLSGYSRLMEKWNVDICKNLETPSLQQLKMLKTHGPVGYEFSYRKLINNNRIPGSFLIRQSDKEYDVYYLDIVMEEKQILTSKLTRCDDDGLWILHEDDKIKNFDDISHLVRSITKQKLNKLIRYAPTDHDQPELLTICAPLEKNISKQNIDVISESNLREKPAQILQKSDMRVFIDSKKFIENNKVFQVRGNWMLPGDKKMEVTLKCLRFDSDLSEFIQLANEWSVFSEKELRKMYGFILTSPYSVVYESIRLGTLDTLLQSRKEPFSSGCLIKAGLSLARALLHLKTVGIIHKRIRCSSLLVAQFEFPNVLTVRLCEKSFDEPYTDADIPWIPFEYLDNLEEAKTDITADTFAFGTTLWEIYSNGLKPNIRKRHPLKQPINCSKNIYSIMINCWKHTSARVPLATLLGMLVSEKENYSHSYSVITKPEYVSQVSQSNGSVTSNGTLMTEVTLLNAPLNNGGGGGGSGGGDDDTSISTSNDFDTTETIDVTDSVGTTPLFTKDSDFCVQNEYFTRGQTIELDAELMLIFDEPLGCGNYGIVQKGRIERSGVPSIDVAVKGIKNKLCSQQDLDDWKREINIMKKLNHPNIVKIITTVTWEDNNNMQYIVMEFLKNLSFDIYLSAHLDLTVKQMLEFSKQIAEGMNYLVTKQIVHRDLAARNILLSSDNEIKISDFGLARLADSNGYYYIKNERALPVKWYAPETLDFRKYSHQSDVWSYGVTLFEIFSGGDDPILRPGMQLNGNELSESLKNGERLKRPKRCPQIIYDDLLMGCWKYSPKDRLTFKECIIRIELFLSHFGEEIN